MTNYLCFETYSCLIFGTFMGLISLYISLQVGEFFFLPIFPIILWNALMYIRSTLTEDEITK